MQTAKALYLVVCAAGPAKNVGQLVTIAQSRGWTVQLMASPQAYTWLDIPTLEKQTGLPVRNAPRHPIERPVANGVIIAPASFNTINKLAAGISDTYILDILNGELGRGQAPVVILPFVDTAVVQRTPFKRSLKTLREDGVSILLGGDGAHPHPPGIGEDAESTFPWGRALDEVEMRLAEIEKANKQT